MQLNNINVKGFAHSDEPTEIYHPSVLINVILRFSSLFSFSTHNLIVLVHCYAFVGSFLFLVCPNKCFKQTTSLFNFTFSHWHFSAEGTEIIEAVLFLLFLHMTENTCLSSPQFQWAMTHLKTVELEVLHAFPKNLYNKIKVRMPLNLYLSLDRKKQLKCS